LVLTEQPGMDGRGVRRHVDAGTHIAGERHLGQRGIEAAVGDVVTRGDEPLTDQLTDEIPIASFHGEIDRWRRSVLATFHLQQVELSAEVPGCGTDRHDRLLRIDETDAHRALEIVDDAYAAYDGGGLYRASVRLVVKGHVAGHYREVERQTGGPHPFDAADELPHCLWPLGVAEVHVVRDRQRPRTYGRKIPPRLGNGLPPSRHRIGSA